MNDVKVGRIEQLTQHTRGPWELDGRAVLGLAFDKSARMIVERVRGGSPEAADANARLIAAAPDLLEALRAMVAMYDAHTRTLIGPSVAAKLAKADAAIAKAETGR